jgi:hypothetical protein
MSMLVRPPRALRALVALATLLAGVSAGAAPSLGAHAEHGHGSGAHPDLRVDRQSRTVTLVAEARPEGFSASLPPDHQYHALVYAEGSAAAKSLFVTSVPDTAVARALRELGAEDGGGVPLSAWTLRWVPLVPQPAARVDGTPLEVWVRWGEEDSVRLAELLHDSGGEGLDFRFGGNEEHNHAWASGCILCLFSCPGGVVSNAAYTIRDHQRGATLFEPGPRMPPQGTRVEIVFSFRGSG